MATAKISAKAEALVHHIQHIIGGTKMAIIERALQELDRTLALKHLNQAYLRLKSNPKVWESELKEREIWEKF